MSTNVTALPRIDVPNGSDRESLEMGMVLWGLRAGVVTEQQYQLLLNAVGVDAAVDHIRKAYRRATLRLVPA